MCVAAEEDVCAVMGASDGVAGRTSVAVTVCVRSRLVVAVAW
jgi:hypothetical protein